MSILIKGMEMPTSCEECRLTNGISCYGVPEFSEDTVVGFVDSRPDFCPLIELPPHGRLIDADELSEQWYQLHFDRKISDGTLAYWNFRLSQAKTIIEAEGEE